MLAPIPTEISLALRPMASRASCASAPFLVTDIVACLLVLCDRLYARETPSGLHAHYAHFLATGNNLVGRWVRSPSRFLPFSSSLFLFIPPFFFFLFGERGVLVRETLRTKPIRGRHHPESLYLFSSSSSFLGAFLSLSVGFPHQRGQTIDGSG